MARPKRARLRVMRFALWAQHVPVAALTPRQISGVLGISEAQAREWRTDWLAALSPIDDTGLPPYQRPPEPITPPRNPSPAATGTTEQGTLQ